MNKEKYKSDLKDIKDIMDRSSRFISLSGLSGITAGIIGLLGAFAAYYWVYTDIETRVYDQFTFSSANLWYILLIAVITLTAAIASGVYFTVRETRKQKLKVWDNQTKRLLINLIIPLITGGLVCLVLMFKGYFGLVPPLTLIFYGLALVNASKYTLKEIRSLGLLEIALGLISLQFIGFGLLFWAIGFGLLHIIYGIFIPYNKQA